MTKHHLSRSRIYQFTGRSTEPAIRSKTYDLTATINNIPESGYFAFMLKGKCKIKGEKFPEITLEKNKFTFLPGREHYRKICYENSHVILVKATFFDTSCFNSLMQQSKEEKKKAKDASPILIANDILANYFNGLSLYLKRGTNGDIFHYFKLKELFFILNEYYTQQDLAVLFHSILDQDLLFIDFVQEKWREVKNAGELARISNYCESAFNRKFKKVFGTTPYKWLNREKAMLVYEELRYTDKPFKIIADEYNFNSLQHFNDYCVRNFQVTPGRIRGIV